MKLPKTYGYLKKDLDSIEKALYRSIQAEHPILREASTELVKAGGKRIRPIFVLLSSQLGDFHLEKVLKLAVSLELIHMATLVHDDVIDDATLRRGKPTIKHQYGNRVAMYTGDYLLARALEEVTSIKDPRLHQILSKAMVEVCIGEIEQMKDKFNIDQSIRNYLRRIKRKTALLIAISCQLGGLVAGLPKEHTNQLYRYGYYVGMSFQIIDDILDFTSTAKELGKPVGNDLIQGNITLPVLFAMEDRAFTERLQQAFQQKEMEKSETNELLTMLKRTNAIEQSYEWSNRYLQKALTSLANLPDEKAKQILKDIALYIGKRKY